MKLSSPDFEHEEYIPEKFTCDGEDISPSLIIEDIPQETKRLALIVEDPDAPAGTWIHWIVFNIHVTDVIEEGCRKKDLLKAMEGHILAEAELVGLYLRK